MPKEEPTSSPAKVEAVENKTLEAQADEICAEETSEPLPGLDFAPPCIKETVKEEPVESIAEDEAATQEEPMETDESREEANDTLKFAEQTVIIEELGEFGVQNDSVAAAGAAEDSTQNSESNDVLTMARVNSPENASQDSQSESKVIVKGSGGFVLKVNQESMANGDTKAADATFEVETPTEPEIDWTPPTPDPAYTSFPTTEKGTEMSGLCSIM